MLQKKSPAKEPFWRMLQKTVPTSGPFSDYRIPKRASKGYYVCLCFLDGKRPKQDISYGRQKG